jgi:signal transduction histidine kinase
MTTAARPDVLTEGFRAFTAWCRREALTLLCALMVALFLHQSGVLTTPLYVAEKDVYLNLPTQSVLSPVTVLGHVSVVVGVLLAKRSAVLATVLTMLPFAVLPWWDTFVWGWLLGTITVAVIAASVSWRRAALPYVAALAVSVYYCLSYTPAVLPIGMVTAGTTSGRRVVAMALYVVAISAAVAVSAGLSSTVRARRHQRAADEQHERAVHAEVVTSERALVARDLHDVVAHHVSLVAVRAESAPYQHPGLDDRTRAILGEIADDARQALAELRQVLVVLQRAEGSGDGGASRAPQPGATDVDELVVSARAAGQEVDVDGAWGVVPPAQGYVLYRAVQEGLTNARRHAPREVVTVTRTREGATVGATLWNTVRRPRAVAPGRGLVGMRERVEALGGTMVASVDGSRFELTVTLPVDVAVEAPAGVGA